MKPDEFQWQVLKSPLETLRITDGGYEVPFLAAIDRRTRLDLGSCYSRRAGLGNKVRHILVGRDSDNHRPLDPLTRNT